MNKRMILGIIWCIIALALISLFLKGLKTDNNSSIWKKFGIIHIDRDGIDYEKGDEDYMNKVTNTETYNEKIEGIEIDIKSLAAEIIETDKNYIDIQYIDDAEKYIEARISNNKLEIKQAKEVFGLVHLKNPKVIVGIPKDEVKSFDAKAQSGAIKVIGFNLDEMNIRVSSGAIKLEDTISKAVELNSSSGAIKASNISFDSISAKASSGAIKLEGKLLQADLQATSGSIKVENEVAFTKDSSFSASSGTIKLNLTPSNEYYFETKATSGSIKNHLSSNRFGKITINASVNSGLISINKL